MRGFPAPALGRPWSGVVVVVCRRQAAVSSCDEPPEDPGYPEAYRNGCLKIFYYLYDPELELAPPKMTFSDARGSAAPPPTSLTLRSTLAGVPRRSLRLSLRPPFP